MHSYSARDVERLVHLPRTRIRSLVEAGFVSPARGPRNAWRFSFQDLIILRTAQALAEAHVPQRRITQAVKELRRRLPGSMPLSGLNIAAEADRVVVREGDRTWGAETGQYLLRFEGDPDAGTLSVLERQDAEPLATAEPAERAQDWFDRGADLEARDPDGAREAYERAIAADPGLVRARINLGRLLHETGRLDDAERVYRDALRASAHDPLLHYDLAVLLEDMGRRSEALDAYRAALREDPRFADCHYNLGLLCRRLGKPKDAIQHLAAYRRLTATTRPE
ncbi:MAG TPA: tetratricopeptide repeat protein [Candidatus Binatia bacterium]|nr:tetratricopeptide repeat protein [Candidatus Binatia bacterium]